MSSSFLKVPSHRDYQMREPYHQTVIIDEGTRTLDGDRWAL